MDHELKSDLIHYSRPHRASREHFHLITDRSLQGMVVYPGDYTNFFSFHFTCSERDIQAASLGKFEIYFDFFAEDFQGRSNEAFVVQGRKIAENLRKKVSP